MPTPTEVDWYLWNDIGYTEGSAETPYRRSPESSDLRDPDVTIVNQRPPAVKDMFSYVKLKKSYRTAKNWKYLKMVLSYPERDGIHFYTDTFYGWVDNVEYLSETTSGTDGYVMVGVTWHVDLWRTYLFKIELKRGVILRRGAMDGRSNPPQNPRFFNKRFSSSDVLIPRKDNLWWIFFAYVDDIDGGTKTAVKYYCFPILIGEGAILAEDDSTSHKVPTINEFLEDTWDETLGLTPSRLVSAYISPIAPMPYTKTEGTNGTVLSFMSHDFSPQWEGVKLDEDANRYCWRSVGTYDYVFEEKLLFPFETYDNTGESPTGYRGDDITDYVITGLSGEVIGRLPFGKLMKYYQYRIVASASAMYIQIRWKDPDKSGSSFLDAGANDLVYDIPLIPIDTASNSYSEYNYTGARDYDRYQRAEQLRFSRETQLIDTVTSMGIAAGGTAIGAAAGGSVGALGGAGGLISGAGNLIGLGVHTALSLEEKHNGNLDTLKNAYMARQSDSLQHAGAGLDVIMHGKDISMNKILIDSYSVNWYEREIEDFGYKVCEPQSDCDSLVSASGPLMIDDLNIVTAKYTDQFETEHYYHVPIEAIQYIKSRLKRGVLLV